MAMDLPSIDFTSGSIHDPTKEVDEQPDKINRIPKRKKKIFVFIKQD